ncbi:hypothetical protein Tco_1315628 [Tanacetum coccineum]
MAGARVGVKTYLLGGAIDGSKANGIIPNPKLELENSCFTFDLVPLSHESVDVVIGENWLLRHKAGMMLYRGVGRRSKAKNEFEIDVRQSDLDERENEWESGLYRLDKVRTSIWRDVRTLAIKVAYTTKYSIHPRADTMLCGFRLTNRWLSMKKDIASCGSKYLAYLEVEVEYQGSSRLLLQPELPK